MMSIALCAIAFLSGIVSTLAFIRWRWLRLARTQRFYVGNGS